MSRILIRPVPWLASLLAATALTSCADSGHGRVHGIRTGAIRIGSGVNESTGSRDKSRAEERVESAVCRGIERALVATPDFNYIPQAKLKAVPSNVNDLAAPTEDVKHFAARNNLGAVMHVHFIPHLKDQSTITQQSVSVRFSTRDREGQFVADGVATAANIGAFAKDPIARATLAGWEATAYAATQDALARTVRMLVSPSPSSLP